jgi:hypothetical protein
VGWFRPSKEEVWEELCRQTGGELVKRGFWKGNQVQLYSQPWTIVLDTYTESSGDSHTTYTRARAPFLAPMGFRFAIYRKGLFSGMGKLMGMQDIEIGEPDFDDAFIIQGNDEDSVRAFFSDRRLRQLIQVQPRIRLEIKDNEGWFGTKFPDDVDEVRFLATGVIKDLPLLKSLFELIITTLEQLCRIRAAARQDTGFRL